ncbi:hypothetical protein NQ317_004412 [Molorchus minor]|uniref:RWD domain-containing protein n=1 Tax=Molorchus minor TaxID=1323400 RepID=A0ABQ9IZ53_9CUCU|nr:hypothetical protein NQ317_004412 [Molorchus minor]
MDYAEEQRSEIEALESIYYGDFEVQSKVPQYKFSIPIKTEEYEPDTENGLSCDLVITYTPKYPEEAPIIQIENPENFEDDYETVYLKQRRSPKGHELAARILLEEEEAEQNRFEGTRVTVETFLKWKQLFEDEMGITTKREIAEKEGKKLTGRELFMTDKTLNESDLKFLDEGDAVKVDESLFQDLDDLDLDDDEDDEDFDPNNYHSDSS